MIYRLYAASDKGWFSTNKDVLARVFDEAYPYMITALSRYDIINWETNPMTLPHPEWFSCQPYRYAASVVKYREKAIEFVREYNRKLHLSAADFLGAQQDTFIEQYEHNVGLIKFRDTEGMRSYMANPNNFSEEHSRLFFQSVVDRITQQNGYTLAEKRGVSMGQSEAVNHIGRYYHIATSLPKSLKPYTNIQYGVDTHNSHPLLFNFLIFNYFINNSLIDIDYSFLSISNSILFFNISKYLSQLPSFQSHQYVLENLCKFLKDNSIIHNKKEVGRIPYDALRYIQDTSSGQIWDKVQQAFPHYSRDEVKENMFRHVFYSNSTRTGYYDVKTGQYVVMDRKEWVEMFKQCYPSVHRLINAIKRDLHSQCTNRGLIDKNGRDSIMLPHLLMRFESVLFTRALNEAFQAKIPAIGIHDCIAVVDDSDTIDVVQQQRIVDILNGVYRDAGLVPSLSIEVYRKT